MRKLKNGKEDFGNIITDVRDMTFEEWIAEQKQSAEGFRSRGLIGYARYVERHLAEGERLGKIPAWTGTSTQVILGTRRVYDDGSPAALGSLFDF